MATTDPRLSKDHSSARWYRLGEPLEPPVEGVEEGSENAGEEPPEDLAPEGQELFQRHSR